MNETHIRINSFLAKTGMTSRRGADELIASGKVRVNGKELTQPGLKINPAKDSVEVQNKKGVWETLTDLDDPIIYALYKPKGYVTSMKRQGRDPIVSKLVPKTPRVFPVGRLDKESEGLMLMTNDGDLSHSLMHPKTHVEKEYIVHCIIPKRFTENTLKSYLGRVAKGVRIEGKKTLPSEIHFIRFLRPGMVELRITLREGRNRQIRKMLGTIHLEVVRLIRIRIGKLDLDTLQLDHGKYVEVEFSDIL